MPCRPFLAAALLVFTAIPLRAQSPFTTAWSAGGSRSDIGEDVALDADGNVFAVGTFEGTATFDGLALTAADDDPDTDWGDVFVVKYAPDGEALWARRGGTGVFNDFAEGVTADADGNVYVAGFFTGIATFDGGSNPDVSLTTRNDFDAFLAKYDADGDLQWVEQAGGPGQDTGRGVAVAPDGSVYFAGGFAETGIFGDGTVLTSAGSSDAFLAKYDADGALLWVRQGGSPESDGAWNVDVDAVGAAYAVGTFRSVAQFDGLPIQSAGLSDVFIVKYDVEGAVQWLEQIGANGAEYGRGIAVTTHPYTGGMPLVHVTGSFENTILIGADVLESAGLSDVVLASLNGEDGALLGGARGGSAEGFDIGNDLAAIRFEADFGQYDHVLMTGYVEGDATFEGEGEPVSLPGRGFADGFLAIYQVPHPVFGSELLPLEAHTLGGSNTDRGYGIGIDPNVQDGTRQGAVTGAFRDTAFIDDFQVESEGNNDVYAGLFNACTPAISCNTVATEPSAAEGFNVGAPSPNPALGRTEVEITLDAPALVRVDVLDVLGRQVARLHDGILGAGSHRIAWDAARSPSGVYSVRVVAGEVVRIRRVTLLR